MYGTPSLLADAPFVAATQPARSSNASGSFRARKRKAKIEPPRRPMAQPQDEVFGDGLLALMPFLRAFAHTLCKDRELAEELAQDALCRAWEARSSFLPGSNLKAWLFTILRNQFYSHTRRAWRQAAFDEAAASDIPGPEEPQDWAVRLSDALDALSVLPAEQRRALLLVGVGGFAYAHAAKLCGCPEGTVKSRVGRARRLLAAALESPTRQGGDRPPATGAARQILCELDQAMRQAA